MMSMLLPLWYYIIVQSCWNTSFNSFQKFHPVKICPLSQNDSGVIQNILLYEHMDDILPNMTIAGLLKILSSDEDVFVFIHFSKFLISGIDG